MDISVLKNEFKNPDLLDHALTHRSWVNEHPGIRTSNERLEFLGDAILEFVVSRELFQGFPDKEEGYLTALRANLVNTVNLSLIAEKLEIGKFLNLSKGEIEGGGRSNKSLLADTVEAIIGALFIDSGLEASEKFILTYVLSDLDQKVQEPLKDAKSRLQELVQANGDPAPRYVVSQEEGPDHDKTFTIEVVVSDKSLAQGMGKSKGQAEQNAAVEALKKLEDKEE